jgi:hypothetical protein
MPKLRKAIDRSQDSLARELLDFHDDFAALNRYVVFVLHALASALADGDGLGEHPAVGAMFCAQWVDDRAQDLERRLKKIRRRRNLLAHPAVRDVDLRPTRPDSPPPVPQQATRRR